MRSRMMVVAFLERSGGAEILMLQRSSAAKLFPGVWAGVGGHIEPHELNDPDAAILREIEEETGLRPQDVSGLRLRGVVLRLAGEEIRQQYVYVGAADQEVGDVSPEGLLRWVRREQVLELDMSFATRAILERHLTGAWDEPLCVGVLRDGLGGPETSWCKLRDWEGVI